MLLLALFLVLTAFSVAGAEGWWKMWNLLIILGCCGVGFGLAYIGGLWSSNMALAGHIAVPATFAFGSLGAVLCPRKKSIKELIPRL